MRCAAAAAAAVRGKPCVTGLSISHRSTVRMSHGNVNVTANKASCPELEVHCKTPESRHAFLAALQEAGDTGTAFFMQPDQLPSVRPQFDGARYLSGLRTSSLGHVLLAAAEMPSTQEFMRQNSKRLGARIVTVTDRQSSGKGRGGNQWISPEGCLMFTVGSFVKVPASQAPFINYVLCLALVSGVMDCLEPLLQGAPADIRIKWPNDIYSGGMKIAGVLIHTTWSGDCFCVLSGVGLNVANRHPTRCLEDIVEGALQAAGRPLPEGGVSVRREDVLAAVINRMDEYFTVFEMHGFGPLEPQYLRLWLHSGQRVGFDGPLPPSSGTSATPSHSGSTAGVGRAGETAASPTSPPDTPLLTIRGLTPSGFLLAEDDGGRRYELTPDGNSLDMMQGMLRRKLPQ